MNSFYWYDYETFGLKPSTSRIAQFAGVRTDTQLNIIPNTAKKIYCKPPKDCLPSPTSVLITSITPQLCAKKGISEFEFIKTINTEFSGADTCIVGYNNIRFDDEFTRYTLFRNFFDPYSWSYKNNNSRWDIIDVVRMCYALKKDSSLKWVLTDGVPSFKLDKLTIANGIKHTDAHDALADVYATIAIAKKIKQTQPKLFAYALQMRNKAYVKNNIKFFEPILHTSGMYANKLANTRRCVATQYSALGNSAIIFNLDQDPSILLDLTTVELQKLIFTKTENLPTGTNRLQIKELHFNKSPMFVTDSFLQDEKIVKHLQIDMDKTNKHLKFLQTNREKITDKITQIFTNNFVKNNDAEQMLYAGFLSKYDRICANKIINLTIDNIQNYQPKFKDKSLDKLWIHFKARNYLEYLSDKEKNYYDDEIGKRIQSGEYGYLSIADFDKEIKNLKQSFPEKIKILDELNLYIENLI